MTHSYDSDVLRAAVRVLWAMGEAKRAQSVAGVLARLEALSSGAGAAPDATESRTGRSRSIVKAAVVGQPKRSGPQRP